MTEHPPTPERPHQHHPRIWVGCLADYTAGRLHGTWLDAAVDTETLLDGVQRMLADSQEPNAEEWGIFDSDDFGLYRVNEYDDLAGVARVARGIAEHGSAFAAWAELHDGDEQMLDSFEDSYLGTYESAEAWAEEVLADGQIEAEVDRAVPDSLRSYIKVDYAAFARDAELSGDIYVEPADYGRVYLFRTS